MESNASADVFAFFLRLFVSQVLRRVEFVGRRVLPRPAHNSRLEIRCLTLPTHIADAVELQAVCEPMPREVLRVFTWGRKGHDTQFSILGFSGCARCNHAPAAPRLRRVSRLAIRSLMPTIRLADL